MKIRTEDGIKTINGKTFFFDGCHKFYIVENKEKDIKHMLSVGWSESDMHPISELPKLYRKACGLRFIDSVDLKTIYVKQFEEVDFIEEGKEKNEL